MQKSDATACEKNQVQDTHASPRLNTSSAITAKKSEFFNKAETIAK
jgi:hypothetical protein